MTEENGQIYGYILFIKVKVENTVQLGLALLAVLPEGQGKGIGGALISFGYDVARKLGYEYSILLGHTVYYPRFGYEQAVKFSIKPSVEIPEEYFMAINLQGKKGIVEYTKEFMA